MSSWIDWGYWGVFLLMVLENVIPPIPSEVIMSIGGIAAAQGKMNFAILVAVGTAGTVLGNLFWYEIGRRFGYKRLEPVINRWGRWLTMDWESVEKLRAFFDRWGGLTVFIFRFMPVGRTLISLPAGLLHMKLWRFIAYTAAGSMVWNIFLVGIGYWLGTNIEEIDGWIAPAVTVTVVLIVALYLWRVITWKPRGER
ncbi:MAG: DedA family protein [Pseudomonadota bacterium]